MIKNTPPLGPFRAGCGGGQKMPTHPVSAADRIVLQPPMLGTGASLTRTGQD